MKMHKEALQGVMGPDGARVFEHRKSNWARPPVKGHNSVCALSQPQLTVMMRCTEASQMALLSPLNCLGLNLGA